MGHLAKCAQNRKNPFVAPFRGFRGVPKLPFSGTRPLPSPAAALARFLSPATLALALIALFSAILPEIGILSTLLSPRALPADFSLFSPRNLTVFGNSAAHSFAVALCSSLLGYAAALALAGKRFLTIWLFSALAVPFPLMGTSWTMALLRIGGDFSRGWTGAFFAETLAFFPLAVAAGTASLFLLDFPSLETASVFRNKFSVFCRLILPQSSPMVFAGGLVIFIFSLSDFSIPGLFGCPVYSMEIFSVYSATGSAPAAFFQSLPLLAISFVAAPLACAPFLRFLSASQKTSPPPTATAPAFSAFAKMALSLYLLFPAASLLSEISSFQVVIHSLNLASEDFFLSATTSFFSSCLCLLSLFLALHLRTSAWGWPAMATLSALFAIPPSLTGIGMLSAAQWMGLRHWEWTGNALPPLALAARFLPAATWIFFVALHRTNTGELEAASVFQKNKFRGLASVLLPSIKKPAIAATLLCFTLSIGEIGASLLVAQPGNSPLMVRIYNLLHYGAAGDVAALLLSLQLAACLAGFFLSFLFSSHARSR